MILTTYGEQQLTRQTAFNPLALERRHEADGAMSYLDLENLVRDMENEPPWREDANLNAAYYDNHQTTAEQRRLEREGQPIVIVNLIARAINAMLGQEAKARSNWELSADDDEWADVVGVLQYQLTEAQRETNADLAISEAYASQCKAGLGWVEVSRDPNPFAPYKYRVRAVHRNELWWDWRTKTLDLSDCRWIVRCQWIDVDEAEAAMPAFADVFRYYGHGWNAQMLFDSLVDTSGAAVHRIDNVRRAFRVPEEDWLDTTRRRIKLFEVWYTVFRQAVAIVTESGVAAEFNPRNPIHQEALSRGQAKLVKAPKRVLRRALFCGPHRLIDQATTRKRFPYVPFWAFRDDETRAPYAPTQGMRSPQDEYNARRSRLMWLLQAMQVFIDNDAVDKRYNTIEDVIEEIMRPDAAIVMNAKRANPGGGIRVDRMSQMPQQQFEIMQDAKMLIQEQPGIYTTMLGNAPQGVTSGIAMNSLVEAGLTAMGDLNDNYRMGRRLVGEAVVDLLVEDHARPNMQARIGRGEGRRVVVLNTFDPETKEPINMVKAAPVKLAVGDAPSSPGYQLQQQEQMAKVMQAAGGDPQVVGILLPDFIEATTLRNKEQLARVLRKRVGLPQPGDRERQIKQEQEQAAAERGAIEQRAIAAKVQNEEAKALQARTAAQLNQARAQEIIARIHAPDVDAAVREALAEAEAGAQ